MKGSKIGVFTLFIMSAFSGCMEKSEFRAESDVMRNKLECKYSRMTPANDSQGSLFSCIGGEAETVKYFINEEYNTGKIKSIKLLWNEWTKDRGYGLWADSGVAKRWAGIVANRYAPELEDKLVQNFQATSNTVLRGEHYTIRYTYEAGPEIDEHMFVVTKNNDEEFRSLEFKACVFVTRDITKYKGEILGDSIPIQHNGYVSYELGGNSKDQFICEIYEGWDFRIKAAYGGHLPFIAIGGGKYNITY